jgi:putative tryptophan/tyrosine transport system substrate-binding protein
MTRGTLGLLVTLALGLLVAPLAAEAQPLAKVPRIGVLSTGSPPAPAAFFAPFIQGLRELGYVEGQHIALEYRYAEGNLDRLPDLAAELVRLPVDLLVAGSGSSALAAKQATTTLPIVFFSAADVVERGLVASLARPGGNITGVSFDTGPELVGKRLELLKDAVPTVSRVAMLVGEVRSPTADANEQAQERAARVLGLTLQYFYVLRPEAFTEWVFPAITADTPAIEALYVGGARGRWA